MLLKESSLPCSLRAAADREQRRAEVAVERGALVRVLAVAQVLDLLEREVQAIGEGLVRLRRDVVGVAHLDLGEVARDRRVVAAGVAEGLLGEVQARRRVDPFGSVELLEQQPVVRGVHHDGHVLEVLGGSPDHAGTADVDVLDGLVERAALGDLLLEGIQVHHDHVDRGDRVLRERRHVRGLVAPGQDAGVDPRVQGLHSSVEDLREAGGLGDARDGHARGFELGRGPSGREDLEPARDQPLREVHDAFLAVDGQQCSPRTHGASG